MKHLYLVFALATTACVHAQTHQIQLCDQQATPNCLTWATPATLAGNFTQVGPPNNTAGFLKNDGSGNLTWVSAGISPPFPDNAALVEGHIDATKQVIFDVSSLIPTATTVSLKVPNCNTCTFMTLDATQLVTGIITFNSGVNFNSSTHFIGTSNVFDCEFQLGNGTTGGVFAAPPCTSGAYATFPLINLFSSSGTVSSNLTSNGMNFTNASVVYTSIGQGIVTLNNATNSQIWSASGVSCQESLTGTHAFLTDCTTGKWTIDNGGSTSVQIDNNAGIPEIFLNTSGSTGFDATSASWKGQNAAVAQSDKIVATWPTVGGDIKIYGNTSTTQYIEENGATCQETLTNGTNTILLDCAAGTIKINGVAVGGGSSPPFLDTQALVENATDHTKLIHFSLAGITSGQNRVLVIQDANQTLANLTSNQTFSGTSTFSGPFVSTGGMTVSGTTPSFNNGISVSGTISNSGSITTFGVNTISITASGAATFNSTTQINGTLTVANTSTFTAGANFNTGLFTGAGVKFALMNPITSGFPCNSTNAGYVFFVPDAASTTPGSLYGGGGAIHILVGCDGSAYRIL